MQKTEFKLGIVPIVSSFVDNPADLAGYTNLHQFLRHLEIFLIHVFYRQHYRPMITPTEGG